MLAASALTNICYPTIKLQNCKGLTAGGTFGGLKSNCFLRLGWVTTSDQVHCSFIWLVLEKLQGCSQLPCHLSSWWKRFSYIRAKLLLGIRVCRLASQASTCVSSSEWSIREDVSEEMQRALTVLNCRVLKSGFLLALSKATLPTLLQRMPKVSGYIQDIFRPSVIR